MILSYGTLLLWQVFNFFNFPIPSSISTHKVLYGKTYQTVTIWTAFLVTGMTNFHTEPPYGDKCHRMKAWYEEFIPVTIWKFHTKMVTDMNIIHMVTYHMVTYSYWYENEYFFQMVTCSDGDINDFNRWMIFFFRWWHVQTVTIWNFQTIYQSPYEICM